MAPETLSFTDIPLSIRPIAHFIKVANEYAARDIAIYYWCLYKAVGDGMRLDSTSPDSKKFLYALMNILEQVKKDNKDNETVMQDVVAQAHIEDQARRLFQYAESQDKQEQFNQKTIKAFYTCGYLFDLLEVFGTLDDNIQSARKYAKWRATYIFGCLKRGEKPVPGNQMGKQPEEANGTDFAKEINDELSAELSALNTSISGPAKPQSAFTHPTNEYGFAHHQPPPANQQPSTIGYGAGAYPSVGQQYQQPTVSPGPKPGLQEHFRQPPPSHQPGSPINKPPVHQQSPGHPYHQHYAPAEPSKPAQTHQMSPQPAAQLKLEDYLEAKKYTKFAASALDYEDPKTAIDYLQKAIKTLQKQPI